MWAIVRFPIWSRSYMSSAINSGRSLGRRIPVPSKPKRPCSFPGCPQLTSGRFCDDHAKVEAKRYEQYDRDPETQRRYGRAWKRIRDRHISQHPLCEQCEKDGKIVPAAEVHHKVPISQGGTHARDNLIALCKSCHARIHAERGDRWHNP